MSLSIILNVKLKTIQDGYNQLLYTFADMDLTVAEKGSICCYNTKKKDRLYGVSHKKHSGKADSVNIGEW